jgi:hypothetical protein
MDQDRKKELSAAAQAAAVKAADKARTATGWKKWLYFAAAIIAAGIALFTATGCAAGFVQTDDKTAGIILILPLEK